jgi:hypothetical protein
MTVPLPFLQFLNMTGEGMTFSDAQPMIEEVRHFKIENMPPPPVLVLQNSPSLRS